MPKFTIEQTFDVPHFAHITVEADNLEQALKLAAEFEDWENTKEDWDCCGPTRVTGAWEGEQAYHGRDLLCDEG